MLIKNEVIALSEEEDTPAGRRAAHRQRLVNGSRGVVVGFRKKLPADDPAAASRRPDGGSGGADAGVAGGAAHGLPPGHGLAPGWAAATDNAGRQYYYEIQNPSNCQVHLRMTSP